MGFKITPILFLLVILSSCIIPASASENVTINFADMELSKDTKIIIHSPTNTNDSYIGEYNATDEVTLDANHDYVFTFKPSEQTWFNNPLNAIELLKKEMPTAMSYLLFIMVIVGCFAVVFKVIK